MMKDFFEIRLFVLRLLPSFFPRRTSLGFGFLKRPSLGLLFFAHTALLRRIACSGRRGTAGRGPGECLGVRLRTWRWHPLSLNGEWWEWRMGMELG